TFRPRLRELLDLLHTRPHLRGYPREICIRWNVIPVAICRMLIAVIKYCTRLRKASIYSLYTSDTSEIFSTIFTIPRLENLSLSTKSLHILFRDFTLPSLKSLRLSRYGEGERPEYMTMPWFEEPISMTGTSLEHLLPQNRH